MNVLIIGIPGHGTADLTDIALLAVRHRNSQHARAQAIRRATAALVGRLDGRPNIEVHREDLDMIETPRACGASAKFAGSGGSVLGIYLGEPMYGKLEAALAALGAYVIKPKIV